MDECINYKILSNFLVQTDNSLRYSIYFEFLIFKIFESYLQSQSKNIIPYSESKDSPIDFILPKGIDEINEPVGLIVKTVKGDNNSFFAAVRRSSEKISEHSKVKRLLFVFGSKISPEKKDELITIAQKITRSKTDVWDINDLNKLYDGNSEYWTDILINIDKLVINNVVTRSLEAKPNQWKEKRQEHINSLKEAYKKDDLVLFLGAGVSKDANIPDWNVLVSDLLVEMISEKLKENSVEIEEEEQKLIVDQIIKNSDISPLLQARYIRTGLRDKFINVITKLLYKNINENGGGTSELLNAITHLCTPRRNSIGIKSVVTYNFDDLLEDHLSEKDISYIPIYKDSDTCSNDNLAIYHVHGFLPRKPMETDIISNNLLVFSEEGYHAVILDPYCWSNITQLNLLRENTCLLIGLSLTDPNLRRLLDIAARKTSTPKHYAIIKRQTIAFNGTDVKKTTIQSFNKVDQELKEESYRELGLKIIWVDNYNEIPEILNLIRE